MASMGETRLLDMRYLARCKARGPRNELSAVAWVDGRWSAIFPEPVLRGWFNAVAAPDEAPTLYAVLGLKEGTENGEVKAAYRRLARQWHPDVCKEPNATEQFRAIKHAYDVLSDPSAHTKYDAGLKLEALARSKPQRRFGAAQYDNGMPDQYGYRAPLRCGYVMTQGAQQGKWFIVASILAWQDIIDAQGRVLSSSWPAGADRHEETWGVI